MVSHTNAYIQPFTAYAFQSLSGIMVVSHSKCHVTTIKLRGGFNPFQGLWWFPTVIEPLERNEVDPKFQSLSGIMVVSHFEATAYTWTGYRTAFQSLSGIMVVSHHWIFAFLIAICNSFNPFQGLWWFPTGEKTMWNFGFIEFQSLSGIMVVSHRWRRG